MKIYLVAGNNCESLKQTLERFATINIVKCSRTLEEAFACLKEDKLKFDTMLLIDQGGVFSSSADITISSRSIIELFGSCYPDAEFRFVTKELQLVDLFRQAFRGYDKFYVHPIDKVKIPVSEIINICLRKQDTFYADSESSRTLTGTILNKSLGLFKKSEAQAADNIVSVPSVDPILNYKQGFNYKYPRIPGTLNRVIALTGHRGSGITGTAANLAMEASSTGLKAFAVDLDIENRGLNLYFSKFGEEVDLNPELAASLVKCLLKPDACEIDSCRINDNLSITTLAYSVGSKDNMLKLIDTRRLLGFLGIVKFKYNFTFLDIPLHILSAFSDLLIQLDSIGICVNNNLHSIISTSRNIVDLFNGHNVALIQNKAKVILTNFNENNKHCGNKLTGESTCEILSLMSPHFNVRLDYAGIVPYHPDFDLQIDSGKKLCSVSNEYKRYYSTILHRLI